MTWSDCRWCQGRFARCPSYSPPVRAFTRRREREVQTVQKTLPTGCFLHNCGSKELWTISLTRNEQYAIWSKATVEANNYLDSNFCDNVLITATQLSLPVVAKMHLNSDLGYYCCNNVSNITPRHASCLVPRKRDRQQDTEGPIRCSSITLERSSDPFPMCQNVFGYNRHSDEK
jgi:hypothetical protein